MISLALTKSRFCIPSPLSLFPALPQVSVVSASVEHLFSNDNSELVKDLHNILCFFNPLYPLMGCLDCITKVGLEDGSHFTS